MNIPMKFSESATSFSMKVEEEGGGFRPNMGEFQVIHDGQNGATFYPIVSEDGVLSWTNDMDLPNPEPVDISGKDGKDGRDGKDGYTPVKDVDYRDGIDGKDGKDGSNGKDGYTPIKGVDYFDGKDGKDGRDGVDGYTPIKGIDYFDGKDGKDGIDGRTPVKGVDYVDGKDGKDGVSATHYWNGTVLTVTSASGTSSADLKGAKGDKGDPGQSIKGDKGDTGQAGYTPVKDKDYFDGKDGYSPTVAVTDISGGHRVTITDKNGAKAFDVMDGKDGQGGGGGSSTGKKLLGRLELNNTNCTVSESYENIYYDLALSVQAQAMLATAKTSYGTLMATAQLADWYVKAPAFYIGATAMDDSVSENIAIAIPQNANETAVLNITNDALYDTSRMIGNIINAGYPVVLEVYETGGAVATEEVVNAVLEALPKYNGEVTEV